jgi:hypothetical protein
VSILTSYILLEKGGGSGSPALSVPQISITELPVSRCDRMADCYITIEIESNLKPTL